MNTKKLIKHASYLLVAVLVGVSAVYPTSKLTPPGSISNTMYSLTDIYNLSAGTTTDEGTGTIDPTPGTVAQSEIKTLTEVYTAISGEITKLTNDKIAKDETAFGFTGTLYGDTDPTKVLTTADYPGTATAGYALPSALLKTGQTHCNAFASDYGSSSQVPCTGTNQDGDSKRGIARSYTDNADGTITDNKTGLMWQKCSMGQTGLDCLGGSAENPSFDDGNGNSPAINYCENLSLATHTNWYLPSVNELQSIVDYGKVDPAIDTTYFPITQSGGYWSSTAYENYTDGVWIVYFVDGYVYNGNMDGSYFVRCVRE